MYPLTNISYETFNIYIAYFLQTLLTHLRIIRATALCYALKMLQRVFPYCANEYKMDVNSKFGILYFLFSGVYTYNSKMGKVVPHRNAYVFR